MKPVSLLIKPVSGKCNMACSYCFYRGITGHDRGRMSFETVEKLVSKVFDYADAQVSFAFQGGEPTLAGLDFYRFFVSLAERKNKNNLPVFYSIQTNGLSPSVELCKFFGEKRFLVGISLDGTRTVHNKYRCAAGAEDCYGEVLKGIEAYRACGADVNILTVVTSELVRRSEEVWDSLAALGLPCLQFILCLESTDENKHGCAPSVSEYGDFLIKTFDKWKHHIEIGDYISVRWFDNIIASALGYPSELCSSAGRCSNQLVCEADGSVYPCDFYVDEKYREGNICKEGILDLLNSEGASSFISERPEPGSSCRKCKWAFLCNGGCRREFEKGNKTAYCAAYKRFFAARERQISDIIGRVKKGRIKTERL